jgi:hypothetical protein
MIILPAQFEGFRSRSTGDRLLTLCIYQENADEFSKITNSPIGTEYLVMMIPTANTKELHEWKTETKDETISRFRKHMNALISDCAQLAGRDYKEYREYIKSLLKRDGLIETSTMELSIDGLATVISKLKKLQHEFK